MRKVIAVATVTALAGGLSLALPGPSATATVSATGGATTITVTMSGDDTVRFSCVSGTVRINGATSTPSVTCAALTKVTINGGIGQDVVHADDLNTGFPALTSTSINTSNGNDIIFGSKKPDQVIGGGGADAFVVSVSDEADTSVNLGGDDNDTLYIDGTAANDSVVVSNAALQLNVATKITGGTTINRSFAAVTGLVVDGMAGNDGISASALNVLTGLAFATLDGGDGNDTLTAGPISTNMSGGTGTNTITGNTAPDYIFTASDTDVIDAKGGQNRIADVDGLRSGGRTIADSTGTDTYDVDLQKGDAVWRVRPGSSPGTARTVASLNRPGLQDLPASVTNVGTFFDSGTEPDDHTMADIVALDGKTVFVNGGSLDNLIDITIPTGSWANNVPAGGGTGSIDPTAAGLGTISLVNVGPTSVHGPWTNKNRGFVHRATRDLLFRFASTATLDEGQAFLGNGTLTRPQVTTSLMDTDEYRGLDVDRTFVKYLRRKADPGGRTYWINSIENGKALWRFRAQLFGSNEYFTKAGGTNASYVAKAYADVLGRAPDAGGKAYWTNKLNNGADRGSVALQFINSPEARRRLVDDQFLRFLDRKPTSAEQTTWVDALPGATGEQDLIASLVNSGAYYNRS